ncbi:MAG: glucose 1-dehydrogenase [Brevundimonas sp.]|jgi:NAD(P)-dependent dehydrogenase (short-subunit alcohol dehydrogenase family)|uniref:SDR family NAD(P)-dependent oxidoreductase n=1 Tax=Brevundimonas sp. TaxID=1871086 RepID=UPI0025C2318B|nr:glucose 1-dehydrogenase [Brevundimonas sp.]MCH4267273.1 glucose 1-dehydrogenase [Brevundimonas sp.]
MQRLKGKVAVVTGAAMGLGHAIATRMAEEGARVALLDRLEDDARASAATLVAQGFECESWACDVSSEDAVRVALEAAAARFGRLDVLVNNAGVSGADKPTHEITEAEWDWVQAVNVKGVFFGVKHAVPLMRQAGGGSIINLSSIYGLVGGADVPPYHASKGAVRLMTKTDALLYAADRIRVNSIHPGFIQTPMVDHHMARQADPQAARKAAAALHPLGHMGEPDDVAWGAVYLASDEAKFVTGAELVIDGGYTAR